MNLLYFFLFVPFFFLALGCSDDARLLLFRSVSSFSVCWNRGTRGCIFFWGGEDDFLVGVGEVGVHDSLYVSKGWFVDSLCGGKRGRGTACPLWGLIVEVRK